MITAWLAAMFAVSSGLDLLRLRRCRSCEPRCPNKHRYAIAGNEGMLIVSLFFLVASVMEHLIGE